MGVSFKERGVDTMSDQPPLATIYVPPMSHEKAIEVLSDLERGLYTSHDPDVKQALAMAKATLIAEKLHLERG